jgi:hypothetical protein
MAPRIEKNHFSHYNKNEKSKYQKFEKKKSNGVQRPNGVHAPIKVFSLLKEKNKVSGVI